MPASVDFYGCGLISGRRHAACRKPFPDQLIEPELISGKGILKLCRCRVKAGGADRLMGILDFLPSLFALGGHSRILVSVVLCDELFRHGLRLRRHPGGVRTQIGDDAYRSVSLDIDSLIELLGQPHGFLRGKVENLAGLLLQGGRGKRKRRFFYPLALLHLAYDKLRPLKLADNPLQLFSGRNRRLFALRSIILCHQRLFLSGYGENPIQGPVFLRNKIVDFLFPVTDDAQRHGLHPARTQASFDLRPQKRGDPISHHTVQHTPGLLGIHEIHIDLPGVLERILYRIFGNLIKGDPVHLFVLQL